MRIDIQHIEQFLIWHTLALTGSLNDVEAWLNELLQRIHIRYFGHCDIPGIDRRNSWELLMDDLAGTNPKESIPTDSSYLILMLMELCLILPDGKAKALVARFHKIFIEEPKARPREFTESDDAVNLVSWSQPADWSRRALDGNPGGGHGIAVSLDPNSPFEDLREFIQKSSNKKIDRFDPPELPSIIGLSCLLNSIPLAPFFWRQLLPITHPGNPE